MKKFLLSLSCALVSLCASAYQVDCGENLIVNSDVEGEDLSCFVHTNQQQSPYDDVVVRVEENGNHCVKVTSTDKQKNTWDHQFCIVAPSPLTTSTKYLVTFKYKAAIATESIAYQWHGNPDTYNYICEIGKIKFGTTWQTFTAIVETPTDSRVRSIAFNLNDFADANEYYFDDVEVKEVFAETWDADLLCLAATNLPGKKDDPWAQQIKYAFANPLAAGKYTITFDVIGDVVGDFSIWGTDNHIYEKEENGETKTVYGDAWYGGGDFKAGTNWKTITREWTLNNGLREFTINLGHYVGTYFYIDNVSLVAEGSTESVIPNGDFSTYDLGAWTKAAGWQSHTVTIVEGPDHTVEPEPSWTLPDGEIDITTLAKVGDGGWLTFAPGADLGPIFGTDAGGDNLPYVDITNYLAIKVYGASGDGVRAFINRSEYTGAYQFNATINEEGVAIIDLGDVYDRQNTNTYVHLNGIKAGPSWDSKSTIYGITLVPKTGEAYTRASEDGKFGTVALRYSAVAEGATVYEVESFDETTGMVLSEVTHLTTGYPYIFQANAANVTFNRVGLAEVPSTTEWTADAKGNGLVGCYVDCYWQGFIGNDYYILSDSKLRRVVDKTNVTILANRCYFDPNKYSGSTGAAKALAIPVADEDAIQNVNAAMNEGKIYDLSGREVTKMQKGQVYIMGGMKVTVK